MPILFLICLTFFSFQATSQIFEYQKSNGTIEYSDHFPNDVSNPAIRPITQKSKESAFFEVNSKSTPGCAAEITNLHQAGTKPAYPAVK